MVTVRAEVLMRLSFAAAILFLGFTAAAAAPHRYQADATMTQQGAQFRFTIAIVDTRSGQAVHHADVTTPVGVPARLITRDEEPHFDLAVTPQLDGSATWTLDVYDGANLRERSAGKIVPAADTTPVEDGITIEVKDAELRDMLKTLEKLTGVTIHVADDVHAKVTTSVRNIPWQHALRVIVHDAGYTLTKEDDKNYTVR